MKIEIRNLRIAKSLSEETTAYTAEIFVDGVRAFRASNHGHGGADHFLPFGNLTVQQVDAWLAENEPPMGPFHPDPAERALYDNGSPCDLELFVGRTIAKREHADEIKSVGKKLDKMLASKVVGIDRNGSLVAWKAAPTDANIAAVSKRNPDVRIVNGGDEATIDAALRAYCPDLFGVAVVDDTVEAVYERQRTNRLTAADARFLLAENRRAAKPCPDLHSMLLDVVAEGERRDAEHRAALDARRAA